MEYVCLVLVGGSINMRSKKERICRRVKNNTKTNELTLCTSFEFFQREEKLSQSYAEH